MRNLFRLAIVLAVAMIGLTLYIELSNRKFIKNLPQAPVEKSTRQQNLSSPQLESNSQNTKQVAESFEATEDETLDLQTETRDSEPRTPQDETATPFNSEAASPHTPVPDWRNDEELLQSSPRDPWHQEDMSMKFKDWDALSEDKQLSILHKGMLKEFGDIPEVRTIIKFEKKPKHLPKSIDEMVTVAEALLYLWPSETTRQSLAQLKQLKADGFKGFPGARQR